MSRFPLTVASGDVVVTLDACGDVLELSVTVGDTFHGPVTTSIPTSTVRPQLLVYAGRVCAAAASAGFDLDDHRDVGSVPSATLLPFTAVVYAARILADFAHNPGGIHPDDPEITGRELAHIAAFVDTAGDEIGYDVDDVATILDELWWIGVPISPPRAS